jgi:hypothetical protein
LSLGLLSEETIIVTRPSQSELLAPDENERGDDLLEGQGLASIAEPTVALELGSRLRELERPQERVHPVRQRTALRPAHTSENRKHSGDIPTVPLQPSREQIAVAAGNSVSPRFEACGRKFVAPPCAIGWQSPGQPLLERARSSNDRDDFAI